MAKLTPNNSRSAQMMTRAAGKGMLIAEDDGVAPPKDAENPPSDDFIEKLEWEKSDA